MSYQAIKCVQKSEVFLRKAKQTDLDSISPESLPVRLSKSIFIIVFMNIALTIYYIRLLLFQRGHSWQEIQLVFSSPKGR